MKYFTPVQNPRTTPPRVGDLGSIMLGKLALLVARGGLEMEEKLKTLYGPTMGFVWSSDLYHELYKQKVAEYIKSPPPTPPAQSYQPKAELLPLKEPFATFEVGIPQGMTRKYLGVIKLTTQFAARYGFYFSRALSYRLSSETQFQFLDRRDGSNIKHKLFSDLVIAYGHVIMTWEYHPMDAVLEGFFAAFGAFQRKQEEEEGEDEEVDKVTTDRRDFVVSDEYFVDIESKEWPPLRERLSPCLGPIKFRVGIPEGGITGKELGVIKLTTQFVTRYGNEFRDVLWERVCNETQFQFLKRNPGNDRGGGRYTLFSQLLLVYANVIRPWGNRPRKSDTAGMEAVLGGFFAALEEKQEEEDEEVDKVVTDRRDFVVSDEYFVDIEFTPPPETESPPQMPPPPVGSCSSPQMPLPPV